MDFVWYRIVISRASMNLVWYRMVISMACMEFVWYKRIISRALMDFVWRSSYLHDGHCERRFIGCDWRHVDR